jgi:IS30 family transposase
MKQLEYTTTSRKGKHLTKEDRIKLEALFVSGLSPTQIGKQLGGRSRRTIEREIKRGKVELLNSDLTKKSVYSADIGQQKHDEFATNKGPMLKIGNDHELVADIEKEILAGCSPYAAIERLKQNGKNYKTMVSYKTVYNYLDKDLFLHITNKDLLVKRNGKKKRKRQVRIAYNNTKGTSISERPKEIESRKEYGHWEMDTVVGKIGTKAVLLVLSERKTREEIIYKLKSKTQSEVLRYIDCLERKYGSRFSDKFKTITCDNGCENLNFKGIEKSIRNKGQRTKVYYAHPFSAWERGTNENINKMIRRFIPKGCDISVFSKKDIQRIQHWINNYPRRILGGLSANMAVQKYFAA